MYDSIKELTYQTWITRREASEGILDIQSEGIPLGPFPIPILGCFSLHMTSLD
jgi:hypothetical protein